MSILEPKIYATLGLIYTILLIAFIIYKIIAKRDNKEYQELKERIVSWFYMITFFTLGVYLNDIAGVIFLALISYLAFKEYVSLIPTRIIDRRIIFYGYLFIIPQFYFAYTQWYAMYIITIPVYLFLFLPFRQIWIGETNGFIANTSKVYWGAMLFIFALSHSAYLFKLSPINDITGPMMLLYLLFLTEINDVFQYVCGKLFGKKKIVPKVSPGKTTEGFLGALVLTTIMAILLRYLTPFNLFESIFAGLIIASAGFIGDVVVSMLKRDVGVKDSSNMIAGHGGMLDRLDSLTYTAPLFFHFVYYIYY
ncbi:MAG: phosphatidate cytidylyltransferase [Campylobacterales bacterium]|nr:phosphatidate cytidylyltransferase [Campylobacterales bacterium]